MLGDLGFAAVADRVVQLAKVKPLTPPRREDIARAVSFAKSAMARRNHLLHSYWYDGTEEGENPFQLRRPRGKAVSYHIEVSVEDLDDAGRALHEVWTSLQIAWFGLIVDFGRTGLDPKETRPGFTTAPNRWRVDKPPIPSPSLSKTSEQKWVEGKISWEELEAARAAEAG